jgi:RHS repeat-associated protein
MWDATSAGNQIQAVTLQQSGGAPTNRIQSVTGTGAGTYTYDAAGNVVGDGIHTYQYDGENRLRTVDSATTAAYAYDYQNRRFKKAVGSVVTHYIWDGDHVLAEHNGNNGAQIVDYVYAGDRLIGEGPGSLLGGNGSFTFLLSERLSPRVLLDKNANVIGRQSKLPFGEELGESGTQEKHHFTTYESDLETGTDYAENRQYAQMMGRFMRVDPIGGAAGNPQSWNRYAYTMGDPVNSTDPLGLFCGPSPPCWVDEVSGQCLCPHDPPDDDPDPGHGGGGGGQHSPCIHSTSVIVGASASPCGGTGGGGGGGGGGHELTPQESKCLQCLAKKYKTCMIQALLCLTNVVGVAVGVAFSCVGLIPVIGMGGFLACLVVAGIIDVAGAILCAWQNSDCKDSGFGECPECKDFLPQSTYDPSRKARPPLSRA